MEKCANRKTKGQCIGALTTGYACNCNTKEITILFCKQIGQSPNTSYAKCRMGLREGKMEMAGNNFSSRPIFEDGLILEGEVQEMNDKENFYN